ncbi:MAG: SbcC/MukB-like Walker B domain-containing protein [Bryocella sp.]
MYLLEKLHLVQFYLFSANTLHFSHSSAIVAPNGSGKSAVLDAMQIVLHGGDQNAIELNAQSGGSKGGRSIRDYLLGYYRDDENVRDQATCYLTMVFRDTTGELPVVSAGISLGAAINEPKHRVYGMYILPGVDLGLEEHTQNVNGEPVPLAWAQFKELAKDRAEAAGQKPIFTDKNVASDFVKSLLFQLRAARNIDHLAFSKALKNALNLKDVHDASAFVRERIIEARPINITEFRHQLETFRGLKARVAHVKERIGVGEQVLGAARKAILTRMRKASYVALSGELRRDQAMDQLDNAQNEASQATLNHDAAKKRETQAKDAHEAAKRRLSEITDRAKQDPAFAQHGELDTDSERVLIPLKKNLVTELRRIVAAFGEAKSRDGNASNWGFLAKPWESLYDRILATPPKEALGLDVTTEVGKLKNSLAGCQPQLEKVRERATADANRLDEAQRAFKTAAEHVERAKIGKSQLPDNVMTVRRVLEENGIEATPVCDLIKVSDTSWAPAIEAYLRSNVYALLVEPSREDEALRLYQSIPDSYHPFGVKVIQPRRYSSDTGALPARALARLITGQNELAVGFLRSRLRRLVQIDEATSRSEEGLTRKGMLVSNGTIERLWLPPAGDVLLGNQDSRAKMDFLVREKQRLAKNLEKVERDAQRSKRLFESTSPLMAISDVPENVVRWLGEHAAMEQELDDRRALAQLDQNPDLVALQELLDATNTQYQQAWNELREAIEALGAAKESETNATVNWQALKMKAETLAQEASRGMLQPFVDAGWIDERRTEWDRLAKSVEDMVKTCCDGVTRESTAYGTQESDMRTSVLSYVKEYPAELAADPSDPDAVQTMMEGELKRLQDSELANYQQQSDDAYLVAVSTFRSRIAASLRSSFDDMANQLRELNRIMDRMPAFTNDERYHFRWWVNPEYKALHRFITEVADRGGEDNLFADPVNTPDEFRALLEDVTGPSQELLRDYRKFFAFEVEVRHQGVKISDLKSRMEKGSGGEHRAPLFVVAGAALAAAYGKLQGDTSGLSLILFDELGDKIDGNNTKAVFEYLIALGLQPVVAAPDDALGKINESIESYVELYRDGAYLSVNHVGIGPDARELLTTDSIDKHPELLEEETRKVMAERGILG